MRRFIDKIESVLKTRAGWTLVEVLVSLAILAMVIWIAGGAMYMASDSYALTTRMQNDEYAARTAMLNISRELHRGWRKVEFTPPLPIYQVDGDDTTPIVAYTDASLFLSGLDSAEVKYVFDKQVVGNGEFIRVATSASPVSFEQFSLQDFEITIDGVEVEDNGSFTFNGEEKFPAVPRLNISLTCENGLEVSTKVALLRIPPVATPG
jgi:prepilin-type N-terminal cleavage/methylation domain-containing protein